MNPTDSIRRVLASHGKLKTDAATIAVDADLYGAGMTSHASVNVMLGLEDAFEIEFPDEYLTKSTFCSISAIEAVVSTLRTVDA